MELSQPTAACLGVGTELLDDIHIDRNSLTVVRSLASKGYVLREKRVVGDSVDGVARAVSELLARFDVVVRTGGLGPTADDVTREGIAAAVGRPLVADAQVEAWIRERYAELGREMPELCLRMARVVPGSRPLPNPRGSAPGLLLEHEGSVLAALPGVPWEMELMLERDLVPELERRRPAPSWHSRTLLLGGVVESAVEQRVAHLYDRFGREHVTILGSFGVIRLVLSAPAAGAEGEHQLDRMESAFREVLGDDVAGVDVDNLEEVVLEQLALRHQTLATAESCTGGLVGARMTDIPGASAAFLGGVICYSNAVKRALVGVPEEMLVEHGAVSEPVARRLAEGVRERFGAGWGVGITGVAGPSGGTPDKPVGLVHWAVAGPCGTWHQYNRFPGSRKVVREWSASSAIDLLRRVLLEERSR